MSSKTRREQKRKRSLQRQQQRQQKQGNRKRKYNPHKHLTRNQKEVASRLIDGEVTMLSHGGWGFTERFLVFMKELGVFELLGVDGKRFYRSLVPKDSILPCCWSPTRSRSCWVSPR